MVATHIDAGSIHLLASSGFRTSERLPDLIRQHDGPIGQTAELHFEVHQNDAPVRPNLPEQPVDLKSIAPDQGQLRPCGQLQCRRVVIVEQRVTQFVIFAGTWAESRMPTAG